MAINLDVSKINPHGIVKALAPLMPGTILVGGLLIAHASYRVHFFEIQILDDYTKLAVLIGAAYTLGFIFAVLINFGIYTFSNTTGYLLGYYLGKYLNFPQPWRNLTWRRLARAFIGDTIAPKFDIVLDEKLYTDALAETASIEDSKKRIEETNKIINFRQEVEISDIEWFNWYQILTRFHFPNDDLSIPLRIMEIFHQSGWAALAVLVTTTGTHWAFWVISGTVTAVGVILLFVTLGLYGLDSFGYHLSSRILQEILRNNKADVHGTTTEQN